MSNPIARAFEANADLVKKVFPQEPKNTSELLKGATGSPPMMKLLVDTVLSSLKTIPDGEFDAAVTAIKTRDARENLVGKKFMEIFFEFLECTEKLEDADLVKNLSSSPIQKQISRLLKDPKLDKILSAVQEAFKHPDAPDLSKALGGIENPEGKKLAESLFKKFKILPPAQAQKEKTTFKEKLAKAWKAIVAFFKKVCCCCKKKEKNGEVNANKNTVTKTQNSPRKEGETMYGSVALAQ